MKAVTDALPDHLKTGEALGLGGTYGRLREIALADLPAHLADEFGKQFPMANGDMVRQPVSLDSIVGERTIGVGLRNDLLRMLGWFNGELENLDLRRQADDHPGVSTKRVGF